MDTEDYLFDDTVTEFRQVTGVSQGQFIFTIAGTELKKHKLSIAKRIRHFRTGLKLFFLSRLKFLWRYILILSAILVIVPIVLTVLYTSQKINPVSTLMLARLVSGNPVQRNWVALDKINPVLVHSVMMSEDAKFCTHSGIDFDALNQVIDDAIDGEKTRGASTLSMQTVKNLYLWPGRSYLRKAVELPLALMADAILGKRRMIEIYLNIAEWGEGIFGIEAAAQHYFKRGAKTLNAYQSALLAVSLPNPKWRNPARPGKSLMRLAKKIERRAYRSGAYVKCVEK